MAPSPSPVIVRRTTVLTRAFADAEEGGGRASGSASSSAPDRS